MKVYITKYALTEGITEHVAELCSDTMIRVAGSKYPIYYHKPDWHRRLADAVARAEDMRVKKIAALQQQLAKLEAITFA